MMIWCRHILPSRLSGITSPSSCKLQSLLRTRHVAAVSGSPRKRKVDRSAIERNKVIVGLGKAHKVNDIFALFEKEKEQFDNVNWATTMVQLGRSRSLRPQNPKLLVFVGSLADCLEERGLHWFDIRQIGNLVHAIAKKNLKSADAQRILEIATTKENARSIVHKGNPRDVANTAWACATLGYKSPNIFAGIEEHAAWLVSEGNPQDVALTAWACATLGFKSPNLFANVDKHAAWLVSEGNPQAVANTA